MARLQIKNYHLTVNLGGMDDSLISYKPEWDAPILTDHRVKSLLKTIEYNRQRGIVPIVTVFIPKTLEKETKYG